MVGKIDDSIGVPPGFALTILSYRKLKETIGVNYKLNASETLGKELLRAF